MHWTRWGWAAVLLLMTGVLPGCALLGAALSGDETPERLPRPKLQRHDPLELTPAQQVKQDEVEVFLAARYAARGWRIAETTQLAGSGDIIDWLDPDSVPGSDKSPPPPPDPAELVPPPDMQAGVTELDLDPEALGPEGTIPELRPTFSAYVLEETGATSVEDWIENHQVLGQPGDRIRLYAGLAVTTPLLMASSRVSQWGGASEPGTMSLLEMAVKCTSGETPEDQAKTEELVGVASSRDLVHMSKSLEGSGLRLRVEFTTAGPNHTGNAKGGWDGVVEGFVPVIGRPFPVNIQLSESTLGGPQFDSQIQILFHDGDWWIGHQGRWLGYYPGTLFDLMGTAACQALWYGEVYDPTPTDWTWTDMGSGNFGSADSFGQAAYFRSPYYVDTAETLHWVDDAAALNYALPNDPACYTMSKLHIQQDPVDPLWSRYFYVGGPGGDAPGCD